MKPLAFIHNEKGLSTVEAAIILPLLILSIFGIIDFGLLLFNKHILTNASREAARSGIVVGLDRKNDEHLTFSSGEASNFCASNLVSVGSSLDDLEIETSVDDIDGSGSPSRGDVLNVRLSYTYNFIFLSAFGLGPVPLEAISVMQLE
jgi:Flp pilus assembly protein TadG